MNRVNTLGRVFGLHAVANAVLLVLVYVWLGIRDARLSQFAVTALLALAILAGALLLHAGTWHWFRARDWRVPRRTVLRSAAGFALLLLAWWLLSLVPVDKIALWTASTLTLQTRKPISPEVAARVFGVLFWLVRWFILPVLLFGQARNPRFWFLFGAALLVSVYVPQRLVHWTPDFKSTALEVLSMVLRWGLAYTLAIAGWLAILRYLATRQPISVAAA